MNEQAFLFLEGVCVGIVTGAGLCLWVMWKDKISMMREIERLEREVDDAMERLSVILERSERLP